MATRERLSAEIHLNCERLARATPAMADEPPRTPERPPRTPPGAPPPRAADPRELERMRQRVRELEEELAAHAYNAAVRALPADVQARRKTNPVVDGQLVPKPSRKRRRADAPAARRTSAHAAPVPRTSDETPCANCGGRPCDGAEFERFASSGKRHKTCTTCKADRTLRKAAARLRVLPLPTDLRSLVNPKQ